MESFHDPCVERGWKQHRRCSCAQKGFDSGPPCQTSGLEPVRRLPKFPHNFFRVPSLGSSLHASQGTGRGSRTKLLKEVEGGPNNRIWHRTAPRRISDSNGATMINCCTMIRSAPRWVPLRWQPGLASAVQGQHVDNIEQPRLVSRGAFTGVAGDFAVLDMQGRRQTLAVLVAEITSRTYW